MRRRVLDDCYEADMSAAQLALVGAVWDVPPVRDFLGEGQSFWADAIQYLVVRFGSARFDSGRDFDFVKGAVKLVTYGVCFGAEVSSLIRFGNPWNLGRSEYRDRLDLLGRLRWTFGVENVEAVGTALLEHPVLAALLDARGRRMADVEEAGRLVDIFGREYRLGDDLDGRPVTVRSALAAEMQAAEAFVMLRVARLFLDEEARATMRAAGQKRRGRPAAEILLWQSDGFSFRLNHGHRDAGLWLRRADEALKDGCRDLEAALGCPPVLTRLELKYDPRESRRSTNQRDEP